MKKIAITSGDPAGIGPEITSKALRFFNFHKDVIYIVYGKLYPFKDGSCIQKIKKPEEAISSNIVYWIEIDSYEIKTGKPSILSGKVAIQILERCAEDLNNKKIDAVVTCPISKEAIQKSYPTFIGHTEFFAQKSNTEDVIMSFWGPYFNLALITTHLAVCDVSEKLTRDFLLSKLQLIYMETTKLLRKPKIA
ncbi:MAG: 4-hydroxythreonine-4-phosphate dehydrogenase PdxA, partial [Candidatus Cloacimonetes bacterium]|nr:4-hydroxythreonine-4-phosphate dehydrogenase PdxA [Candidatus Cloacimonadota bacterium]